MANKPRFISALPCRQVSLYCTCWFKVALGAVPSTVTVSLSSSSWGSRQATHSLPCYSNRVGTTGRDVFIIDFNGRNLKKKQNYIQSILTSYKKKIFTSFMWQTQTSQQNPNPALTLQTKGAHLGVTWPSGNIGGHFWLSQLRGCCWNRVGRSQGCCGLPPHLGGQESSHHQELAGPKCRVNTEKTML